MITDKNYKTITTNNINVENQSMCKKGNSMDNGKVENSFDILKT